MKSRFLKRIAALSLALTVFAGTAISVCATDKSYTYNYDFWGDVQDSPDFYTVRTAYNQDNLDLDKPFNRPEGLTAYGDMLYVVDTGNNRIVQLQKGENESLNVIRYIDSTTIKGDPLEGALAKPTDIAISEDGNIFIADYGNARILKLDENLNYLMAFVKPEDSTLDKDLVFQPSKIVVDTAERVYCVAKGINKGLVKYENDGTFSGFVGATKVAFDFTDYIWKKFASQEQREKLLSFVPTEYANLYMDKDGFIYVCSSNPDEEELRQKKVQVIRKLNLMGNDILVRNGENDVIGDLYFGNGGPSKLMDITCLDNDIYCVVDQRRGRIFGYDDQGKMVFAFGDTGYTKNSFRDAVSIDHIGNNLYILDTTEATITMFVITEFGETVYNAIEQFDEGNYEESGASWQKAMDLNGNYDLAYIGIGRALLRQEQYREAMDYFELKYDDENYSKAFKQYRKQWVEEHIGQIVLVLLVIILVPMGIGRVKAIKHEIDIADIFKL